MHLYPELEDKGWGQGIRKFLIGVCIPDSGADLSRCTSFWACCEPHGETSHAP